MNQLAILDDTNTTNESLFYNTMGGESSYNIVVAVLTSLLGLVILIGNGLIIVSVTMVRKLRQPANYLIVSLAFSDFLVGLVVLPLTITYDILEGWVFGAMMCNVHVSLDVICCTTSIMNLCMISIDRYLMITRPMTYPKKRTAKLMMLMIATAWIISCLIIIPALFGFTENVTDEPSFTDLNEENLVLHDYFWRQHHSDLAANSLTLDFRLLKGGLTFDLQQEHELNKIRISSKNISGDSLSQLLYMKALARDKDSTWSPVYLLNITSPQQVIEFDQSVFGRILRFQLSPVQNDEISHINITSMSVYGEKTHGKTCLISQEVWFSIYSTVGSFYLPLTIMLCMYWKIYLEASRFKARQDQRSKNVEDPPEVAQDNL